MNILGYIDNTGNTYEPNADHNTNRHHPYDNYVPGQIHSHPLWNKGEAVVG